MLKQITLEGRLYVRHNYLTRGALHCAQHTGLTINQIWGLAFRLGLTAGKKKGEKHVEHREHHVHVQVRAAHMEYHALQQALSHFTATLPTTPHHPASLL